MKKRLEDVAAARAVIDLYVQGSSGDAELLKSIFHEDALMNGYFQGQLMVGSPEPFFDEVAKMDPAQPNPGYRGEIESVDVAGEVATVKLVETDFMGSDFIDFFHLIRVDGKWKIISKTFYQAQPSSSGGA